MYEWLGFFFVSIAALIAATAISDRFPDRNLRLMLLGAVALRIFGSTARYEVLQKYYNGVGDAVMYYSYGEIYASSLWSFDFSIFHSDYWWRGTWWGTQFIRYVSGFVIALIGPTFRGEFVFFSMLSLIGLSLCGLAFHNAFGASTSRTYFKWVWFWPSLWYWPASVGKDALILLALGLLAHGYVGRDGRMRLRSLLPGIALMVSIRPHVAAVVVVAMLIAESMAPMRASLGRRLVGALLALTITAVTLDSALTQLGLADADLEGIQEEFQYRSENTMRGGSQIEQTQGWFAVPMAFVNVLARPFPWEAHNPLALLAGLEMWLFWVVLVRRWHVVREMFRDWRKNQMLRFSLLGTLGLVLMFGIGFANLGIIARQRVIVLPLVFALVAGAMARAVRRVAPARSGGAIPLRPPRPKQSRAAAFSRGAP